jgi:DNA polymerase-3 subunit alpha
VPFVPLHNHSDYSLLDGASQLPAMVERAVELGMPALALTDHGVMYGAIELLKLCTKAGIKPIIGNEMYVINGSLDDPQPKKERRYHLVLLAKNAIGYRNLVKLTSISHLRGMRGRGIFARACIDKQLLRQHSEGLIAATACLGGEVPQAILLDPLDGLGWLTALEEATLRRPPAPTYSAPTWPAHFKRIEDRLLPPLAATSAAG